MQHDTAPESNNDNRIAKFLLYTALVAIAFSVQPFLRRGFGRHYFQLQVLIVIPVMVLLVLLTGRDSIYPLMSFLGAMYVACFIHRLSGYRSLSLTDYQHTRYDGYPWLASVLPCSEKFIKRAIEPLLTALIGLLLTAISPVLGGYLVVAGFLNAVFTIQRDVFVERRTRELNDRLMEQRQLSQRLRELQGEIYAG